MVAIDFVLHKVEAALKELPPGLQDHIERARVLARLFAGAHSVNVAKADLAAAAHDLARAYDDAKQFAEAGRLGIAPNAVERETPLLLHGPIAAEYLRQEMGCVDADVLEAVCWHTTCRVGMGMLGQVVFLADKVEPHKVARRPFLERVRDLAPNDPSGAIALYLTDELERLLREGFLLHPIAVEARNHFVVQSRKR
ncbi:MAG: HD domain-containing protein [Dehalococcoidia bacterium]|nr:HD domain-containing protein [Dehalococcoidia bacterium]